MVALGGILIVVGLAVVVMEAHASTGGILGLVGVLAAAAGIGLMLAGSGVSALVAALVAVALALAGTVGTLMIARAVLGARRQQLRTGPSTLVGAPATVCTWNGDEGQVTIEGTLWRAVLADGWEGPRPASGQAVTVTRLDGLTVAIGRQTNARR